jgi:hypothetical protein
VIRYPASSRVATVAGSSVNYSVQGGYRIYVFNASGSISF